MPKVSLFSDLTDKMWGCISSPGPKTSTRSVYASSCTVTTWPSTHISASTKAMWKHGDTYYPSIKRRRTSQKSFEHIWCSSRCRLRVFLPTPNPCSVWCSSSLPKWLSAAHCFCWHSLWLGCRKGQFPWSWFEAWRFDQPDGAKGGCESVHWETFPGRQIRSQVSICLNFLLPHCSYLVSYL